MTGPANRTAASMTRSPLSGPSVVAVVSAPNIPSLSGYLSKAVSGWDKRLSTGHERRLARASDPQRSGRSVRIRAGVPTVMASMASSDTPRSRSRGTTRTKTWP